MLLLNKCWVWCVKHWKLLLVSIGGFIAFIIGYTRANRNTQRVKLNLELKEKDIELILKNNKSIEESTTQSVLNFQKKKAELSEKRKESLKDIENKRKEAKKEILNSDEKLDKILKDEWGLEKE